MAQRRMVSVKIIDSAKFIKMPVSTQALYFHLIARADDDGIVEAFNVMRMTGASEDDLKVLCAKEFVKVLNEDMVAFITDWHEHNLIRSDRKIDSMYQHLLLQVVPEVELKEKKERADRRKLLMDNHGTSQGQPKDGIGEVRLGQCSAGEDKKQKPSVDCRSVFDHYQTLGLKKHRAYTDEMSTVIKRATELLRCDVEHLKTLLDRHKEVVTLTERDAYPVPARSITEFFGQKAYQSKHLICSEYDDGGAKYERYIANGSFDYVAPVKEEKKPERDPEIERIIREGLWSQTN